MCIRDSIKRSVLIDQTSVRFLDEELLERLSKIQLLQDYLARKTEEIAEYNRRHNKMCIRDRLVIVLVGFQFWLQSSLGGDDPELVMEQLLGRADGIIKAAGRVFPPSVWAAQAMAYAHTWQGWLNLLYVAALSALAPVSYTHLDVYKRQV